MRPLLSRLLFTNSTSILPRRQTTPNASIISLLLASIFPKSRCVVEDATVGMDIRKDRFGHEAVRLLHGIADSHFIAFDFEFSGIAERNRERAGKPTLQERYEETRLSVHEYQPLQIGLTLVKLDETNNRYILEPYNFDLSPLPLLRERQFARKWSMNSGAVSFLQRNGFDFGKQMLHGVPYLSLQEENTARNKMTADAKRNDMEFKLEDELLVRHVRDSIVAWQSQPKDEQEDYLNIPHDSPRGIPVELNAYQRRLVHQIVQNEFPAMKTQGMGHFIQITNPTSEQQASQQALEEEQRERDLSRAIGFRWIIDGIIGRDLSKIPDDYLLPALPRTAAADVEASVKRLVQNLNDKLRTRRKILVGHNCLTDIMFLYRMAEGDLPLSLEDFRVNFHKMFPAIIDTKFLSSCFSEKYGRLTLAEVERDLSLQRDKPELYTPSEFDRYANHAYLHEAGYDSYITAKLAIYMSAKLQKNGSARRKEKDRQQQGIELAAANASSLLDFGIREERDTTTDSPDAMSQNSTNHGSKSLMGTVRGFFMPPKQTSEQLEKASNTSGHARTDSINSAQSNSSMNTVSSVVAVKKKVFSSPNKHKAASMNWKDESTVAAVRSAFASTSIYDILGSSHNEMPGEGKPAEDEKEAKEDPQARMDRLVKEGKMMPRWHEEGAFWEKYGNKLQVNGTQEGMIRMTDRNVGSNTGDTHQTASNQIKL